MENKTYNLSSPAYQKAFVQYLRRGTVFDFEAKEDAPAQATQYIWRTQGDDKVRASHAANDGGVFSFDSPPATGNPGTDFGCRCWAEPYAYEQTEFAHQVLTSKIYDNKVKWTAENFVTHAIFDGSDISLHEVGNLRDVINHYAYVVDGGVFKKVNDQIIDEARSVRNGFATVTFERTYNFSDVSYTHGGAEVGGTFNGIVFDDEKVLKITGTIDYYFKDTYTDPASIRQFILGSSDPKLVNEYVRFITDGGLKFYDINDTWQTKFNAEVKPDISDSIYKWNKNEKSDFAGLEII